MDSISTQRALWLLSEAAICLLGSFSEDEKLNYSNENDEQFDYTKPGIKPKIGNLHLITLAINEITEIFEKIGFTRVRHPEIDSDYYTFEALNMPPNHPARDEWETFFVEKESESAIRKAVTKTPLSEILLFCFIVPEILPKCTEAVSEKR